MTDLSIRRGVGETIQARTTAHRGTSPAKKSGLTNMGIFVCIAVSVTLLLLSCDVAYGENEHWCPKLCECYNDYETADCSRRYMLHLPLFSPLTKRIYADKNAIQHVSSAELMHLQRLLLLSMQNNNLTEISVQAICQLTGIMEISLEHNKISAFFQDIDNILQQHCLFEKLTRLHLDYNKVRLIPTNLSTVAPNLQVLTLSYNELHSVRLDDSFAKFHSLELLNFNGNPVHDIGAFDLAPLADTPLVTLSLSECSIFTLDHKALTGLSNMTSLSLSSNLLFPETLEQVFLSLGNHSYLKHLDLSDMKITHVDDSMLHMFENLESLDLSHSDVEIISPEIFTSLSSLEMINLEGNFLSSITGINSNYRLRKIFLRDNKLQEINLSGLDSLEILDLSGNLLAVLPQNWLSGVDTIQTLNLSDNIITTVSHKAFQRVTLHTLDLSRNKLTIFHRYGLLKVQNLYMAHNKIARLTDNAFDNLEPVLEQLDLSFNEFTEFPLLAQRNFIALQRLNLGGNNLGQALKKGHLKTLLQSLTHLQVFDLSYNNVVKIPEDQVGNLNHLTTLLLQGNRITQLSDLCIKKLKSLAKLVVAANELHFIDSQMLDDMDYLEVIDFSNNPFDCSCRILPLQSWLNITLVMILNIDDPGRYVCATPSKLYNKHIQTVHPAPTDCTDKNKLTLKLKLQITAICFTVLIILSFIILAICYQARLCTQIKTLQYRWQVRYREVSARGAECADQDNDLTEQLSVDNVYAQQVNVEYQPCT